MSFYQEYLNYQNIDFKSFFKNVKDRDIKTILNKDKLAIKDFLALLSPKASNYLEEMAQQAHQLTVQNFGKIVTLYAPLYLANYCVNHCSYCGFKSNNNIERNKLSLAEIKKEAEAIANLGIKNLLILTGESRQHSPISYLKKAITVLKEYFPSLAIEIYPLKTEEYQELIAAGVDSLTIYQEVYDQNIYDQVHLKGPKRDYRFRLNAPERGCKAGMRSVNIGALLGLNNWRQESFLTGLHAKYLQDNYLGTKINLSVPRLRPQKSGFKPNSKITDQNLVQIILAMRIFLPRIGINLSTREAADLRDHLLPLGITKMSAQSSTAVGGYANSNHTKQFAISDQRKVSQIREMLINQGYQPVFKDWQRI